jgi:hypothetical protein
LAWIGDGGKLVVVVKVMIIGSENKRARMSKPGPTPVTITAAQIADQLGETDATPCRQI